MGKKKKKKKMGRTIGRKMGRDGNNWSNRNFGGHPSKASPQYENCRRQNQGLEGSLSGRYYQVEGGRGPRPSFCGRLARFGWRRHGPPLLNYSLGSAIIRHKGLSFASALWKPGRY